MFYIVGIGASAGGLEALENFFKNMPPENDMAFVVIQHLSPDYKSLMLEILSKHTTMEIFRVTDGMEIKPNSIYLIPPRKNMTVFHGKLYLTDQNSGHGLNLPIDLFFKSLAEDQGEKAIGIILSGTGSDGTKGIRAIKEAGGMVMVQDELSAQFDGMPKSAALTGLADYILSPDEMPTRLQEFIKNPRLTANSQGEKLTLKDEDDLNKIYAAIRDKSGLDLTFYKQSTVIRRIERRMNVNQIPALNDYLRFILQSPNESHILYKEVLIGVTRFFRDYEAFEVIERKVIPEIFLRRDADKPVRVWVAGCSTGEEAYSLAILIKEHMEATGKRNDVKLFATDIDKEAIEYAGAGLYSESIVEDIPVDRLGKYFTRQGNFYQVNRDIREMIVFAQHNLIKDPPFNKIDLVTCRNLLIYLQPVLQKKVLSYFHFSLVNNGFLFLGSSETIGDMTGFFHTFDSKWKIFQNHGTYRISQESSMELPVLGGRTSFPPNFSYPVFRNNPQNKIIDHLYKILIRDFMDSCIIIDERYEIIMICGDANRHLIMPVGQATFNVLHMLDRDLSIALATAIRKASKDKKETVYKDIRYKRDDRVFNVDLRVKPLIDDKLQQLLFAVVLDEPRSLPPDLEVVSGSYEMETGTANRIRDLEMELQYTKENLQATIEELETTNEELQATNEELLSANEELQSTNEELQSVNEELITVNSEYQTKIQELMEVNNDMDNFLSNTNIGTLFLDRELNIRKFTPAITGVINLMEQDVGRPLNHISHNLNNEDLPGSAAKVLQTLKPEEKEVQNTKGCWYFRSVYPYRTRENIVKGVVITFVDITDIKKANHELRKLSSALEQSISLIMITDISGNIQYVNTRFTEVTGYEALEVLGKNPRFLKSPHASEDEYTALWNTVTQGRRWIGEFRNRTKTGEDYWEKAFICPIQDEYGNISHFVKLSEDITEQKRKESAFERERILLANALHFGGGNLLVLDMQEKPLFISKQAQQLLGNQRSAVLERGYAAALHITGPDGEPVPENELPMRRIVEEGRPVRNFVHQIKLGKGKQLRVALDAEPVFDSHSRLAGVIYRLAVLDGKG